MKAFTPKATTLDGRLHLLFSIPAEFLLYQERLLKLAWSDNVHGAADVHGADVRKCMAPKCKARKCKTRMYLMQRGFIVIPGYSIEALVHSKTIELCQ